MFVLLYFNNLRVEKGETKMEKKVVDFVILDLETAGAGRIEEEGILFTGALNLDGYNLVVDTFPLIFLYLIGKNVEKVYLDIVFHSCTVSTPVINIFESDPKKLQKTFSDLQDIFTLVYMNGK